MRSRLAVLPGLLLLAACSPESPEAQVKRTFRDIVKAVEASDAPGAVAPLTADFEGPDGLDRGTLQLMLIGIFRDQKVGVTVLQEAVRVDKRTATQDLSVLITGRTGKSLLPDDSSRKTYRLTWTLKEKDKAWKLKRAEVLSPGT
jgi:hypothetical protein